MNDTFRMCRVERVGKLDAQLQEFLNGQGAGLQSRGQRLASDQFHHQIIHTRRVLQSIYRRDVRVIQSR